MSEVDSADLHTGFHDKGAFENSVSLAPSRFFASFQTTPAMTTRWKPTEQCLTHFEHVYLEQLVPGVVDSAFILLL